ncbi:hypothetical protein [Phenylobacterium sp.]|uniref:hypothetical protein n=1 Tax=Phenylobacterium sp. TaxID=1871053 RepID=UPI002F4272D4
MKFRSDLGPAARRDGGWGAAAFAGLAVLELLLVFMHSPWRDEEQALLIAQQPVRALFDLLHYEGHPALWYLLLKAGTAVTSSPMALPFVQAAVSLGTLTVLWRASPFTWPVKLLIGAGYFVLFEYGVIARSYGLGALLFFTFVALRRSPWAWVVLALLANVALHTAILAGICAVWLISEGRWSRAGAATLAAGGLISLATLWPAADLVRALPLEGGWFAQLLVALSWNSLSILPAWPIDATPGWSTRTPALASITLGALPPLLGAVALRRNRLHVLLFLAFYAGLFAVSALVYTSFPRHFGLAAMLFIGLLWAQAEAGERLHPTAWAWLGIMAVGGAWFAASALVQPFSNARQLAAWIRSQGLEDQPWASMPGYHGLTLAAQLGRPSYNLQKGCRDTFQRWDYNPEAPMSDADLAARLGAFSQAVNGGYLLTDRPRLPVTDATKVAGFAGGMFGQPLYVYRLAPGGPERRPPPDCR